MIYKWKMRARENSPESIMIKINNDKNCIIMMQKIKFYYQVSKEFEGQNGFRSAQYINCMFVNQGG